MLHKSDHLEPKKSHAASPILAGSIFLLVRLVNSRSPILKKKRCRSSSRLFHFLACEICFTSTYKTLHYTKIQRCESLHACSLFLAWLIRLPSPLYIWSSSRLYSCSRLTRPLMIFFYKQTLYRQIELFVVKLEYFKQKMYKHFNELIINLLHPVRWTTICCTQLVSFKWHFNSCECWILE